MATTGLAHMAKQAGFEAVGLTGGYSPAPHSRGARRRRSATISTR
jgi:2-methylisocitrate lyase-like PEP mutase family enzyme